MMQNQEFHAATVEEALQKAASSTGVAREDLSFEVLDEGSTGFLGIGTRDARVLVQTAPIVGADRFPDVEPEVDASSDEVVPVAVPEPSLTEETKSEPTALERGIDATPVSGEFLEEIEKSVSSLLVAMGFEPKVDVYDAGDYVAVDVTPDNTALFIGQKGETIDAVQYLVNAAVYRERPFVKRVVLDAEGYRQRRVEAVQGLAHRTARRVIREGQPVELPPMNASERRVVHLYLKDNPGVATESEGDGDDRKVTISPV